MVVHSVPASNFYVKQTSSIMHFHCIKYWRSEVQFKPHAQMLRWKAQNQSELRHTIALTQCTVITRRCLAAWARHILRTHRWIWPFLWRYSSPSRTSFRMVAMLASSNTPLLCSPREMICLMMSNTEPAREAEVCHKTCRHYIQEGYRHTEWHVSGSGLY